MTIWYVNSNGGSDSNNGTSVGTAFATLQKAANSTAAGDTVNILPGNGYGGGSGGATVVTISTSGSSGGGYITYQGYTGRPVITNANGYVTVDIQASYIIWQNTEIVGNNSVLTLTGAWTLIYNNNVSTLNYASIALRVGTWSSSFMNHVQVLNNWCHDHAQSGIFTFCDYCTIAYNHCWNNALYCWTSGSGITHTSGNSDANTFTKNFIYGNVCYANQNQVGNSSNNRFAAATSASTTSGSTLTFAAAPSGASVGDLVYDITTPAALASGAWITAVGALTLTISPSVTGTVGSGDHIVSSTATDGEGIIVDSNQYASIPGGVYTGRTALYNNLCFNNGGGSIYITASAHCDVYFNTTWHCGAFMHHSQYPPSEVASWTTGIGTASDNTFDNNICYGIANAPNYSGNQNHPWDFTGGTGVNNLWFGSSTAPSAGSGTIHADPLFVNPGTVFGNQNFGLQNGSSAIGAASGSFTRTLDILGRAQGLTNLGAFGVRPVTWGHR